jgi:hypothetical protein
MKQNLMGIPANVSRKWLPAIIAALFVCLPVLVANGSDTSGSEDETTSSDFRAEAGGTLREPTILRIRKRFSPPPCTRLVV